MTGKIIGNGSGGHPPGQGGIAAECFHIKKVPPAANGLPQQNAGKRGIHHRQHRQLFDPADDKGHKDRPDDAAVNGQPAAPQIKNLRQIIPVVFPAERNIIGPGAHDGAQHGPKDHIQPLIRVNPAATVMRKVDPKAHCESDRDDNAIPVNIKITDGNCHPVDRKLQPQTGKPQNIHCFTSFCEKFSSIIAHILMAYHALTDKFLFHSAGYVL